MIHLTKYAFSTVALLSVLVMTGCISTSVTPLTGRSYPSLQPDDVVIYLHESDIPADYDKIALIYARGDYTMTDEARMFKAVRKKAAKLGANGVILQDVREPSTGAKVADHFLGVGADRRGELLAIYVRPAAPQSDD